MANVQNIGFAALTPGATLTPFNFDSPELANDEVRVNITHCGICGSDIQAIDNVYSVLDFPFVPGHEVVGNIITIGSAVPQNRLGQRVGVGWQGRFCGHCDLCLSGDIQLFKDVVKNGSWTPYGGFSNSIVVQEDFAYPLPDEMPSEIAAVMMCAGLTVYSALKKFFSKTEQKIGILGIGGLGHLAIQFAKAMDFEVTAISSSPQKQSEAFGFGAKKFVSISDPRYVKVFEDYFDLLLITSYGSIDWDDMFSLLKRKGKIILVSFPEMKFSSVDMVVHELSLIGTFVGRPADMKDMLSFAVTHQIKPMIELMPMSRVNEAINKLRKNQAKYRIVLVNDFQNS